VLVATTVADGASSQLAQTFTMNVTDTASGANFRVVKTTANGNWFFGPAIALHLAQTALQFLLLLLIEPLNSNSQVEM
jgi:hypothetical protein